VVEKAFFAPKLPQSAADHPFITVENPVNAALNPFFTAFPGEYAV
jgi:hypothetical protein